MKTNIKKLTAFAVLLIVLSLSLMAAAPASAVEVLSSDLTDAEIADLLFMREEEKLAHDVYTTLYETWGLSLFSNIAASEQSHTDAVLSLLNAYGIADPAAGQPIGVFSNPDLQALYNQLVEMGSVSLADALKVGAAIEEIDILDLEEAMAETSNASILAVYENLLKGSRNHLRSFVSTISQQTGETYEPQYLGADAFDAIVSSAPETGGTGAGGTGLGNGGSGQGGQGGGTGLNDGTGMGGRGAGGTGSGRGW